MTQPPAEPEPPTLSDAWAAYDELLRRALVLEEITERLAATSADPIAVSDFWVWKAAGTPL